MKIRFMTWCVVLFGFLVSAGNAGTVDIPNVFVAGERAVAAEVNENFSAVKMAVDDNAATLDNKQERVAGSCPAGQGIRGVNADGTVVCEEIPMAPGVSEKGRRCWYPVAIGACSTTVTVADMHVQSVTITPPGPGYVLVTFSGSYRMTHVAGNRSYLGIEINDNPVPDVCAGSGITQDCNMSYRLIDQNANLPTGNFFGTVQTQTTFAVTSTSPVTFYLAAKSSADTGIEIREHSLVAVYFPATY